MARRLPPVRSKSVGDAAKRAREGYPIEFYEKTGVFAERTATPEEHARFAASRAAAKAARRAKLGESKWSLDLYERRGRRNVARNATRARLVRYLWTGEHLNELDPYSADWHYNHLSTMPMSELRDRARRLMKWTKTRRRR